MKRIFLVIAVICVAIGGFGCGGQQQKNVAASSDISVKSDTSPIIYLSDDGYIRFNLSENGDTKETTVYKREGQSIKVVFNSSSGRHLAGRLYSDDSSANIRFTQIFMPDGSADGPFGREISYELTQAGEYGLSIGENMMAGDPWAGEFTIELGIE